MYTKELPGEIIFFFPHSQLFDEVQHQSAFMCKNVVSKEGADLSEMYAITDDEASMFELCVSETMPDVYDIMKPLTSGIENAWYDSITGTGIIMFDYDHLAQLDVVPNAKYAVIRIQDNEAYNPNTVKVVDSALRSTIEQGVLSNFYLRVTHPDITKMSATMYAGQGSVLKERIIPLRKKSIL